jgi:aminopeptidase N
MMRGSTAVLLLTLISSPALGQRLPANVRPDHYALAFDVNLANTRFEGTETIRLRLAEPTARIVLHALDLDFHEVTIRSAGTTQTAKVVLDKTSETASLIVPKTLSAGAADVDIRYSGFLNKTLRGFYLSKANGRNYGVTQFESTDARRAFPSFDEPAMKATFDISLTIDRRDTAISNGRLLSDKPGPGDSRHTLTFATTPKMSSYLVAMAIGDFECIEGSSESIPIRVCATPGKRELGRLALGMAGEILAAYNRYYDIKYPFGKLDMVAIPDFAAGAMENTAAIFYRESDLLADSSTASLATRKNIASVVAHEMAHQWFGDLVTMRWWDDLWLNEGFATWMESRPLAEAHPEWRLDIDEARSGQQALNLDALTTTRPIHSSAETPAEIEETFDVIAYQKGGAVLRMIENYVGREDFRKGVNAYLARHAYGNATSEDFWTAIAAASRKPIDRILPTFVNQPGVPLVQVSLACDAAGHTVSLAAQRFSLDQSRPPSAAHWQIPICRKYPNIVGASCTEMRTDAATLLGNACPLWVFVNAGAEGYYRTAYPPAMLRALAADAETRLTAPERLSLAGDEWALVRAGRHSVADYLTLIKGYASEQESGVLSEVAGRLDTIYTQMASDAQRPAIEAFVRSLFAPTFKSLGLVAPPGDPDNRRALRAAVVSTLATTGNDETVLAAARRTVDDSLSGGEPLDANLAATLLRAAARHGDAALFDKYIQAAEKVSTPEEYYRYLGALAYFEDPAMVDRGLNRLRTSAIRDQDAAWYLRQVLANPNAGVNARAWAFTKTNWTELLPKLSISFADAGIVESLSSFCDAGVRDDIKAFFTTNPRPAATRALSQTIEHIDSCISVRAKQAQALSDWLAHEPTR